MASVTGSKLAFFAPGLPGSQVNVVLTKDGTGPLPTVAGAFNIEVFTSVAGAVGPGFQASAFIQGAQLVSNNVIQAGSLGSTEQLLSGNYTVIDQTGQEAIQIVGSGSGGNSMTVVGSIGDTITGSANAKNTQLIDATGTNPEAHPGPMTVTGGAGDTTVWGGNADKIFGGAGGTTVAGNAASGMSITGGAGDLNAFNFGEGNTVTGGVGSTFIDDGYGVGSGNNLLTGGSGSLNFVKGNISDTIFGGGGTGSLLVIDAHLGSQSVTGGNGFATLIEGGVGDTIRAGTSAFTQVDAILGKQTVTGGSSGGSGASTQVIGGPNDLITGGSDSLDVAGNAASKLTITGGSGNLKTYNLGVASTVTGSTGGTTFIDDSYGSGGGGKLTGGAGESFIISGVGDTITGGGGTLEAVFRSNVAGSETVDLSTGTGAAGVRDVSVTGGLGTKVTVTGFATASDVIESSTSVVDGGGTGPGALKVGASATLVGSDTLITFIDGSTMTILGAAPGAIKFTQ